MNHESCKGCHYGKENRHPFNRKNNLPAKAILDRIHSDTAPFSIPSLGGHKHILTFIDEFSRFTTVYLLQTKDETIHKWRIYRAKMERLHSRKIKELHCDNGGEYISNEMKDELRIEGIGLTTTQADSPQQNGIAERFNRTVMDQTRATMHHSNIPLNLWGELVLTVTYLRNLTPCRPIKFETPYARWHGTPANIQHLRVIWSESYLHVPKRNRRNHKLSPRAQGPLRLIGYSESKQLSYRLYDETTRRIHESRDVTFHEELNVTHSINSPVADDIYEVETILATRMSNNIGREYLVKWTGYDDPTWEPHDYLKDTLALEQFELASIPEVNIMEKMPEDIEEPQTFRQAITGEHSEQWRKAIKSELDSLQHNQTWTVIDNLPNGRHAISSKWVFKVKRNPDFSIKKFKARLVARGFTQRPGLDYDETYSPVVKFVTLRTMLAIAAYLDMEIHQMDVITAFLNAEIDAEMYMTVEIDGKRLIVRLLKSIYGLKQSPRLWNRHIDAFLRTQGFLPSEFDVAFYVRTDPNGRLTGMLALYVDDFTICTRTIAEMTYLKAELEKHYKMEDMGEIAYSLALQVLRDRSQRTLTLGQKKYVIDINKRFNLLDARPALTPLDPNNPLRLNELEPETDVGEYQSMVGSLMYLVMGTRPDIAFAVSKLSQFLVNPRKSHRDAAVRTLRYAYTTKSYVLTYGGASDLQILGYSDADYAGDLETRRSTSGFVFTLNHGAISWKSQRQRSTALSTAEAEYMALAEATKEAVWLKGFLSSVLNKPLDPITLYEDNQSAIAIANNPVDHQRTKHIDIRYHFTRDAMEHNHIRLAYTSSATMIADLLTKPFPRPRLMALVKLCGLREGSPPRAILDCM